MSTHINKLGGSGISGPNYMKLLVQEVKRMEKEYFLFHEKQN